MLSFMHAQYSLFQQGYNLLDEIDPYMKKLAAEVSRSFFFFLSPWSLSSISSAAWAPHELLTSAGCVIYPLKLNWCFDHPQTPEQRFHPRFSRCSFTAASRCEHCLLQYMRSLYYIIIFLIFLCLVWLSAGSAGDRLSHGEEGNGAQTRHHSAEGESILFKAFLYGPT